ncbi:MAG: anthranilate phosphoribosyltransferase [Alphaproteobacteria bacterium]|nr:anthranilate phosphoribosyltransferase [Alphaproteobacteria bacterium]
MPLLSVIEKLSRRSDLDAASAQKAFDCIFSGQVPDEQIMAFLAQLHDKGETASEILGAAQSMRENMKSIKSPAGAIDIVGTGGDHHGTLNISTAVAIIVAACGVPVAKHGNRAATSSSGSSDVLRKLGVNLEPEWKIVERCLDEIGIVFLFAPVHHPAMRHVADVRRKMKTRTIFNLLGPLTNPANVKLHLIGSYASEYLEPMANALKLTGSERAWLVNGEDGLDEISTTAPTKVVELEGDQTRIFSVAPEQVGIHRVKLKDLKGGKPEENAAHILRLLDKEHGPYRDITLFNASAALVVAGKARDLKDGIQIAAAAIDSGSAKTKLNDLVRFTGGKICDD